MTVVGGSPPMPSLELTARRRHASGVPAPTGRLRVIESVVGDWVPNVDPGGPARVEGGPSFRHAFQDWHGPLLGRMRRGTGR